MKSVNYQAPVLCCKSITIQATPEIIWTVLTDINQWTNWHEQVKSSEILEPLAIGSAFVWKMNRLTFDCHVDVMTPYEHFGWTGKKFGVYAIHHFKLKETSLGTEVLQEESMEGFLAKYLRFFFKLSLNVSSLQWLEQLKEESERVSKLLKS